MTATLWICVGLPPNIPPCGASGEYLHTAKTGDSGDAYKHQKATGHSTMTATLPWVHELATHLAQEAAA